MASTSDPAAGGRLQRLPAGDGQTLGLRLWDIPAPCGAVQVVHGLAEHSGRYARLAAALNAAGWAVIAQDVRGHGTTAAAGGEPGHMGGPDAWPRLVADLAAVRAHAATTWPGLPLVLFGHSMGSVLALSALQRPDAGWAAAVLSGPPGMPPPVARLGLALGRLELLRLGARGRSPLLQALSFGAYARAVPDARTPFDWLSRDPAEVDAYIADPWCGFAASTGSWIALVRGLLAATRRPALAALPRGLPLLIVAGTADPVGQGGRAVQALAESLRRGGAVDPVLDLVPGGRHELLNDICRDAVTAGLLSWLSAQNIAA